MEKTLSVNIKGSVPRKGASIYKTKPKKLQSYKRGQRMDRIIPGNIEELSYAINNKSFWMR
jgi:hypothetical protein